MRHRRLLHNVAACLGVIALLVAGCGGPQVDSTASKALFIIYPRFEEHEYGEPRAILEDEGVIVTVAASSLDVVAGHQGTEVRPDVRMSDVSAADYDVIVFVGGYRYDAEDPEAQRIAREAVAEGRLLAAICVAPITLAKAGVVEGKRVTASTGSYQLEQAGAIFTGATVERDGLIITANGPAGSSQFGEAIAAALEE